MYNALYYGVLALAATSVSARAVPGLTPRHDFSQTGNCSPQPLGAGPLTRPNDTAEAFQANPVYANSANSVKTPTGYSLAYQNLQGASSTGGYLGYRTYQSYDPSQCAAECCGNPDLAGCKSFNIYYERDPVIDPGVGCPNPNSTTFIKCSFWTQSLVPSDTTNDGQYCADFHIVIAGSNGYNVVNGGCPTSSTTTTLASTTAVSTTVSTVVSTTVSTTTTTSKAVVTTTKPVTTTTTKPVTTTTTKATTTKPAPISTITACPVPETTYTAKDGSTWAICKGSDFQGQTNEDVHNIYNDNDCAEACSVRDGCTKGVFYPAGSVCYIKGGSLVWTNNPIYDTVRELTGPTPKPTPTPTPAPDNNNWNTWTTPKKTCFLWICW